MTGPEVHEAAALDAAAGQLGDALSTRLRDIVLALDRWDSFVHDPGGEDGSKAPGVAATEPAVQAGEFLLRALRVGLEPVNYRILERLAADRTITIQALRDLTALPRIAAVERANDLAQVGLAAHAVEAGVVRATGGTDGLVRLVGALAGQVAARFAKDTES